MSRFFFRYGKDNSKDSSPEDPALISPQMGVVIGFRYIVLVLVLVLEA